MAERPDDEATDVEQLAARVDALLDRIAATDPAAAELTNELVAALLRWHGDGLARVVEVLRAKAPVALDALTDDVLVSGLLLLHDLHPADAATPLRRAVDAAEPAPSPTAEAFIPLDAVRRRPSPATVPATHSDDLPSDAATTRGGAGCQICGAPIDDDHRHVVDLDERSLLCTCRACGLLFTGGADAHEHFRTVPDRYLHVEPFDLTDVQWATLQIPVGITFVIDDTRAGGPVAFYPSPGGATQSELPQEAWRDVVSANPALADVEPDVEAVLVRNEHDRPPECHIVPVDRCYELVGTMRVHWRGFDGGREVHDAITSFFDDVATRSRPAVVVER